jgi:hypothetical protein
MNTIKRRIIQSLIFLPLLVFIVLLLIRLFAGQVETTGIVLEREYTPSRSSVGVGSSNGSPVIVNNIESAKYSLIIEAGGRVSSYLVSVETYVKYRIGDPIPMTCNPSLCWVIE